MLLANAQLWVIVIALRCRRRSIKVALCYSSLEEISKVTAVAPILLARLSLKGKVVFSVEQALPMQAMPRAGTPCWDRLFDWACGFIDSSLVARVKTWNS
jgi:hypothetical protein